LANCTSTLQGSAAGGKRDVVGDVELELVVFGARHGHAGAFGGFFHGLLLGFHALGPDVADYRAGDAADGRTRHLVAFGGSTDGHAGQGAQAGAGGGALLGVVHVGASAQGDGGTGGGDEEQASEGHEWGVKKGKQCRP